MTATDDHGHRGARGALPTSYERSPEPRPKLSGWRQAELRAALRRQWRPRAARDGVRLEVVEGRRTSDVAFVWLRGERNAVLSLVGTVALREPWKLDVVEGRTHGGRYELSAWIGIAARGTGLLPEIRHDA